MNRFKKIMVFFLILSMMTPNFVFNDLSFFEDNYIDVYASGDVGLGGSDDNLSVLSEGDFFTLANGIKIPYVVKNSQDEENNKTYSHMFLYEIKDDANFKELNLGAPFGTRTMAYGQFQYLVGSPGSGIDNFDEDTGSRLKFNADKLKEHGWTASKMIPQNNGTNIGGSYTTDMGYTYPEAGNYNWKSRTSGYGRAIEEPPTPEKQFYKNTDARNLDSTSWDDQLGNPRFVYTVDANRVGAEFFPDDIVRGSSLSEKNLMPTPWNDSFLVVEGIENQKFVDWLRNYSSKNSSLPQGSDINLDMDSVDLYNLTVNALKYSYYEPVNTKNGDPDWSGTLFAYHTAVSKKGIDDYEKTLAHLAYWEFGKAYADVTDESAITSSKSDDSIISHPTMGGGVPNDEIYLTGRGRTNSSAPTASWSETINNTNNWDEKEIMEIVMSFKYFSVHSLGGHSYGGIQIVHKVSSGGLRYASFNAPREYSSYDLISGQTPELDWIGDNGEFAMRVREYNPDTEEYGDILYQGVDSLQKGKTYIAEWFTGFRKVDTSKRYDDDGNPADISYHSNIKNDFKYGFNDNINDIGESFEKIEGYRTTIDSNNIPLIDYDGGIYDERVLAYNEDAGSNILDNMKGIIGYKHVFTVPDTDGFGRPLTSINLYADISDEDNYYKGSGYNSNDNSNVAYDGQNAYYQIGESSEDFLVAHTYNPVNPSVIEELSLGEVVITEYNGQPYTGQELKPTDKVTFEIYVQRDKESTLEGVAFKDLSMWLEEYPNPDMDLSHYLNSDPLYTTSFNNGDKFTTNAPKITGFKRFNSLTTQHDADWTTYSSSSHQNEFVNAGDVVKFELKDYVIPSKDTIINDTNKWSVNHPAIASLSNIEHLSVQFELNVNADKVNPNTGNDWARLNLKVGKPNKRNMYIEEVAVYDEDGRHIQTFKTEGRTNTSFFISNPLEGGKNYYAVPKVKFDYPYDTKRSNTTNLELHSVPTYNNYPESDMANTKFRVYSDKISYWNDGDIGIYDPTNRSGFNIKTYNPDTDTMNGLVVASKAKPDTKEFNLWIKIPDAETANGNNLIPDVADQVTIHGTIGSNGKNNEVKDIQLFSTSGAEFATKGSDGSDYQLLDPNKSYYSLITVRRAEGSEDSMIDLNPKLKVSYSLANDAQSFETTLSPYTGSQLKNVGDEIVYRLNNLYSPTDYIRIEAVLDVPDTDPSDNTREEIWSNIYNFHVRGLSVTPDKISMGETEYSKTVSHSVSFFAGFDSNGADTTLTNVPIIVEEYQRPKNGNWSFVRRVYQEYHSMTNGVEKQVNFQIDNVYYSQFMDKKYVVKINGGETGSQTYTGEKVRSDNETHVYTASFARETITFSCNNIRSSNSWSTYYQRWDYTGGVVRRGNGPKGPYTYCSPSATLNYMETTKSHYEKLYIKAWFKSTYVKNYIDIMKYPDKANVRAGEQFDLYIQLVYETNRDDMPWTITSRRCNPDWRSPNYSNTSSRPMLHGLFKISSSQQEEYHQYPDSGGGWGTRTFTYNIMPTRHVPSDTQNLNMRFNLEFDEYYGYYPDLNHPRIPLKICPSFTIKVLGGNPVESGTQSIE